MAILLEQWQLRPMDQATRVLVVDDVEDIAEALAELLVVLGYDACAAYSGKSG